MKSLRIRSTRGQREVVLSPRPPRPRLHTIPNRTHILPSHDSVDTDSTATTTTETDSDNDQRPMDALFIEV